MARLREDGELTLQWPPHERHLVEAWLSSVAGTVATEEGLWLSLQAEYQIPVVVRVPLRPMLEQALESFVSWSSDLMLVTDHAADGLSVEINHYAEGDAFDITAWGTFVTAAEN